MFPPELKRLRQWVNWTTGKIPLDPKTGKAASTTDPESWGTYEEAKRQRDIGFVFAGSDVVGFDLDDCVVGGHINDFGRSILSKCKSYAEYSPSGTGLHIFCKGKLDVAIKLPHLEVYNTARYFTVTEKPIFPILPLRSLDLGFLRDYDARVNLQANFNLGERLNSIQEGSRNNDFTAIAGSLRAKNYTPEAIYNLLLDKANALGFPLEELQSICFKSAAKWQPRPQFVNNAASPLAEFMADEEKVEWLVPGVIAKQSLAFVAGLPESLKTFALMDLSLELSRSSGKWLNRFPVNRAKVMFVDQERSKSETQRRIKSLLREKGLEISDISMYIDVRSGTSTRLNLPHSLEAFRKVLSEVKPEIVIFDSFATAHTLEESNRMEIQKVLEVVKELRHEFKCAFLFISHETKAAYQQGKEGEPASYLHMAGNVAIPAAAETVFNVKRQDAESSFLYHTKSTMSQKIPPVLFRVVDTEKGLKVEAI